MEHGSLDITQCGDQVPKKSNYASMYRPGDVTIACSVVKYADRAIENPNRGLMRKFADVILDLVFNRRHGKPFRSRLFD